MSVCQISAEEFGLFAAIATHTKAVPFAESVATAELLSISNCAALKAQYGERLDPDEGIPATFDDIERIALNRLAQQNFVGHLGGIMYNCVTNNGTLYFGELPVTRLGGIPVDVAPIEELCDTVGKWHRAETARRERQAENDVAFAEVGPLPILTAEELKARMESAGCSRVIYAEFRVDESDSQSDYYGGRTGRRVVIGFGTGKRESFKQLRTAAGEFPPTAAFKNDIWTIRVVMAQDIRGNGCMYWKGTGSHWHDEHGKAFATEAEARQFMESVGEPHQITFEGQVASFAWELDRSDYEHRENYSMGGGNYLGTHRYCGWIVRSTDRPFDCEFFDAPKPVTPCKETKRTRKVAPVAEKSTAPRIAGESFAEYAKREWLNIGFNGRWYVTNCATWTVAQLRFAGWIDAALTGDRDMMPDDSFRVYFTPESVTTPSGETLVNLYSANV